MASTNKGNSTTWIKTRKFLNDIHLWGGLISGIVVFIVCLTGTIYTYNTEIRAWALPEYNKVKVEGKKLSPDALLESSKKEIKGKVVGIKIPYADDATTLVLYTKKEKSAEGDKGRGENPDKSKGNESSSAALKAKEEHKHNHADSLSKKDKLVAAVEHKHDHKAEEGKNPERIGEGRNKDSKDAVKGSEKGSEKGAPQGGPGGRGPRANQMAVNPYTGAVIGDPSEVKSKTAMFMQAMFGLHRWLLLNEVKEPIFEGVENRKLGSWISGTATLLFLLGVITGIVIWFPNKIRSWKNGLNIRWSANWKRLNHDLHNTLGFYTCIFLFLMAVTGPTWSFEWYRTAWQKTWGTYKAPDAAKEEKAPLLSLIPENGKAKLTVAEITDVVNKELPYAGDVTINFAKDSTGTVSVSKNRVGFFAPAAGDKLTLDQYSGKVLEKDVFRDKPFNERASSSLKALHIGDVYGQFTKLIYFISCLVATSLPITGVMIWINKMKKKPKKVRS